MAAEGDQIVRFIYTGQEVIPDDATHVIVKYTTFVRARAFLGHPNIVEVICRDEVETIESRAFCDCPSLRRVIMRGVKVVERGAFNWCTALQDVECGKLEIIGEVAFRQCDSLRSINLPSTRIVEAEAFWGCNLISVKFGRKLESFRKYAFLGCRSLERITIPLKDGLITEDNIFQGCDNLKHVDLVEGEVPETINALQLEEWRNDMNAAVNSINHFLPDVYPGIHHFMDDGDKTRAIRMWIRAVLRKIIGYQRWHQQVLEEEVAATLQLALPRDIVMKNVLPFLELPSRTFEVRDHEGDRGEQYDSDNSEDEEDDE